MGARFVGNERLWRQVHSDTRELQCMSKVLMTCEATNSCPMGCRWSWLAGDGHNHGAPRVSVSPPEPHRQNPSPLERLHPRQRFGLAASSLISFGTFNHFYIRERCSRVQSAFLPPAPPFFFPFQPSDSLSSPLSPN